MKNIHEHAVMSFMAKTLANGIPWHVRTPQDAGEQDHRYLLYLHSPQVYLFFLTDKFIYFDTQVNGRKSRRSNERTKTKEHTIFFFLKKKPTLFSFAVRWPFLPPGGKIQAPQPPLNLSSISRAGTICPLPAHLYFLLTRQPLPICIEASRLAHSVPGPVRSSFPPPSVR
jgi:hypothetical protein